jgi:NhaA family Na+:H+ antiporter
VSWGGSSFKLSLQHWINDLLMAVFFFVVGLEIKREVAVGQLSAPRKALLPVSAALGGMIVPAALYLAFNLGGAGERGWGIPMATDIAFALGILSLFGRRVPLGLKIFLTALAIADDLGAVLVIALFYTAKLRLGALAIAGLLLLAIALANRLGVRRPLAYLPFGILVWCAVLASGVHPTVAGILVAMLVPVRSHIDPAEFLARTRGSLEQLEAAELTRQSMLHNRAQLDALDEIYVATADMIPAGIALEERLHALVAFFVLPLFALFNAGVTLDASLLALPRAGVMLGIALGLALGKPIGVIAFTWLAVKSGYGALPEGVSWSMIGAVGILAGVGFTMSLFITDLAFDSPALISQAKLGILTASITSGLLGYAVLRRALAGTAR